MKCRLNCDSGVRFGSEPLNEMKRDCAESESTIVKVQTNKISTLYHVNCLRLEFFKLERRKKII